MTARKVPRVCPKCKGTGWMDAPSHSVERQMGVPNVAVYVCSCRVPTRRAKKVGKR